MRFVSDLTREERKNKLNDQHYRLRQLKPETGNVDFEDILKDRMAPGQVMTIS